ncbi:MAG: quinolinate synthase NadA [Thermoplasmata archaeon]|nr:quinolinate synthase NadA [Thermoplasmata archaeon]
MSADEMQREIRRLAEEKGVLILVHNYQRPEVQDIGDIVGDSLAMALKARETDLDTIMVCGVWFMAETAFLVNPSRRVISPEPASVCPLARMVDVETVRLLRERYPDAPVVACSRRPPPGHRDTSLSAA